MVYRRIAHSLSPSHDTLSRGFSHFVTSMTAGSGDINIPLMMFRLLLLGDDEPQVRAFGLEEEIGYFAPASRFPDEERDPFIPFRESSQTCLNDDETLEARLARERRDAVDQITFIKDVLQKMRRLASALVDSG
jgi:hypothetical protein